MKTIISILLVSFLSTPIVAQVQWLGQDTTFLSLELMVQDGHPALKWEAINHEKSSPFTLPFLQVQRVEPDDSDLRIEFELVDQRFLVHYLVMPELQNEGGDPLLLPIGRMSGDLGQVEAQKISRQIIWKDATENGLYFGRKYTLLLVSQLWGDLGINCGETPVCPFPKNWPFFAAGESVGLGLIGLGLVYKSQADEEFDTYRSQWKNSESWEKSHPFLEAALDKDRTYKVLTYSGIGIAGLTTLMVVYRNIIRHQSKKKKYEKYCPPGKSSLQLKPSVTFAGDDPSVGMALTLKF